MYGFEKKDLGNIRQDELKEFKASAKIYLGYSVEDVVRNETLPEIKPGKKSTRKTKEQD